MQYIHNSNKYTNKKAHGHLHINNQPEYSLYSEGRQNIQELHDLQKYTAYVLLQHPISTENFIFLKKENHTVGCY